MKKIKKMNMLYSSGVSDGNGLVASDFSGVGEPLKKLNLRCMLREDILGEVGVCGGSGLSRASFDEGKK